MHRELVERRRWISERRFLHALNYCMLLPGPEAPAVGDLYWLADASHVGRRHRRGAVRAPPRCGILIGLSWAYIAFGHQPVVAGLFYGIKPAVTAIVVQAAHRIGSRALKNGWLWAIAAASFISIFVLNAPFPLIVAAAGIIGYVGGRARPDKVRAGRGAWRIRSRVWSGAHRRRHAAAAACGLCDAPAGSRRSHRGGAVAAPHGGACHYAGLARDTDANGLVLHQGCASHLRGRLRGASLRVPGGRDALRVAHAHPNDRWPGIGGNHSGPSHHGGRVRWVRRRLRAGGVRVPSPVPSRGGRGDAGDLVYLPAVLLVHSGGRAAGGKPPGGN